VRRLCLDGSNRQPKFIIPTIADRLDRGLGVTGLALASALWCRYCAGTTDGGASIEPNDPSWERLTAVAQVAREDPAAWLAMTDIYGRVGADPRFRDAFAGHLRALWADGAAVVLGRFLA
jgi:mannitol 2-dehydrogenase